MIKSTNAIHHFYCALLLPGTNRRRQMTANSVPMLLIVMQLKSSALDKQADTPSRSFLTRLTATCLLRLLPSNRSYVSSGFVLNLGECIVTRTEYLVSKLRFHSAVTHNARPTSSLLTWLEGICIAICTQRVWLQVFQRGRHTNFESGVGFSGYVWGISCYTVHTRAPDAGAFRQTVRWQRRRGAIRHGGGASRKNTQTWTDVANTNDILPYGECKHKRNSHFIGTGAPPFCHDDKKQ